MSGQFSSSVFNVNAHHAQFLPDASKRHKAFLFIVSVILAISKVERIENRVRVQLERVKGWRKAFAAVRHHPVNKVNQNINGLCLFFHRQGQISTGSEECKAFVRDFLFFIYGRLGTVLDFA